jgi:hypothetical protein
MLEAKIRDLFAELATSEQPPTSVSVAAASQRGRSLLRWRRARMAGTPVLAASAVAAVALTGALPNSASVQPSPMRSPGHQVAASGTAEQQLMAAPAPAQFSPLKPYASFGWLPAGESATSGATGRIAEILNAGAGKHMKWQLSIYAAGQCGLSQHDRTLVCGLGSDGTLNAPLAGRAPAVNGRIAFWLSGRGAGSAQMRHQSVVWQYAPDGWAQLSDATGTLKPESIPIRVASGVVFGGGARDQIEFAAELTKVPAHWQVSSVSFDRTNGVMGATGYSVTEGSLSIAAGGGVAVSDLPSVSTFIGQGRCYFYPAGQSVHQVINGYRAVVTRIPPQRGNPLTSQVCVPNANGLFIFVSVIGSHPAIDPVTLFRHMKLLGANPASWTTQPIG